MKLRELIEGGLSGNVGMGLEIDAYTQALTAELFDVCSAETLTLWGRGGAAESYRHTPVAIGVSLKETVRCRLPDGAEVLSAAVKAAADRGLGWLLWSDGYAEGFKAPEAQEFEVFETALHDRLGLALQHWHANVITPEDPQLHLSYEGVLLLASEGLLDRNGNLKGLDVPVVTSPGYPKGSAALVAPFTIRAGVAEVVDVHNIGVNVKDSAATLLLLPQLNPHTAIRFTLGTNVIN